MAKLNARQLRFAEEYLIDLNAMQAAIRAGYSRTGAKQQGHRLLTHADVSKEIGRLQVARAQRVQLDADAVLQELREYMASDPREAVDEHGRLKKLSDLPAALAKMVRSIDRETGRISFADRLRLMELIGKHISVSAWREQIIHRVDGDLAEMIRAGRERVKRAREEQADE